VNQGQISVVGQGYVGLPLAIAAAESGFAVTGIDTDPGRVNALNQGHSPVADIADAEIAAVLASGAYRASNTFESISGSEIVVICVPTPLDSHHQPDLSAVLAVTQNIAAHLSSGALVIIESTIAPGTTREIIAPLLGTTDSFYLAYSPERIDPANNEWNIRNTPKLVAGLTKAAATKAVAFYSTFISRVEIGSSLEVIEVAKLLENSFRLINISFINEMAIFCERLGIDIQEVVKAAATKPYGFMPFFPSAGVGGHCIPVDPTYLAHKAREIGTPSKFIELANEVNRSLPDFFAGVALGKLGTLRDKSILVVGIAYKPNVADLRESPALGLISALRNEGAIVRWHDDLIAEWNGEKSAPINEQSDLAILVNPHNSTAVSELNAEQVLDTRGGYA